MTLTKKELDLVHDIQDLVMTIENMHIYYQQNIQLFQVYRLEKGKHTYNEFIYLNEENAINKLENTKNNLEFLFENEH